MESRWNFYVKWSNFQFREKKCLLKIIIRNQKLLLKLTSYLKPYLIEVTDPEEMVDKFVPSRIIRSKFRLFKLDIDTDLDGKSEWLVLIERNDKIRILDYNMTDILQFESNYHVNYSAEKLNLLLLNHSSHKLYAVRSKAYVFTI